MSQNLGKLPGNQEREWVTISMLLVNITWHNFKVSIKCIFSSIKIAIVTSNKFQLIKFCQEMQELKNNITLHFTTKHKGVHGRRITKKVWNTQINILRHKNTYSPGPNAREKWTQKCHTNNNTPATGTHLIAI